MTKNKTSDQPLLTQCLSKAQVIDQENYHA